MKSHPFGTWPAWGRLAFVLLLLTGLVPQAMAQLTSPFALAEPSAEVQVALREIEPQFGYADSIKRQNASVDDLTGTWVPIGKAWSDDGSVEIEDFGLWIRGRYQGMDFVVKRGEISTARVLDAAGLMLDTNRLSARGIRFRSNDGKNIQIDGLTEGATQTRRRQSLIYERLVTSQSLLNPSAQNAASLNGGFSEQQLTPPRSSPVFSTAYRSGRFTNGCWHLFGDTAVADFGNDGSLVFVDQKVSAQSGIETPSDGSPVYAFGWHIIAHETEWALSPARVRWDNGGDNAKVHITHFSGPQIEIELGRASIPCSDSAFFSALTLDGSADQSQRFGQAAQNTTASSTGDNESDSDSDSNRDENLNASDQDPRINEQVLRPFQQDPARIELTMALAAHQFDATPQRVMYDSRAKNSPAKILDQLSGLLTNRHLFSAAQPMQLEVLPKDAPAVPRRRPIVDFYDKDSFPGARPITYLSSLWSMDGTIIGLSTTDGAETYVFAHRSERIGAEEGDVLFQGLYDRATGKVLGVGVAFTRCGRYAVPMKSVSWTGSSGQRYRRISGARPIVGIGCEIVGEEPYSVTLQFRSYTGSSIRTKIKDN